MGRCKEENGMIEFCNIIPIIFTIKKKQKHAHTQINGKNYQQKEYNTVGKKFKKEKLGCQGT